VVSVKPASPEKPPEAPEFCKSFCVSKNLRPEKVTTRPASNLKATIGWKLVAHHAVLPGEVYWLLLKFHKCAHSRSWQNAFCERDNQRTLLTGPRE
jgi:hypothetical protein